MNAGNTHTEVQGNQQQKMGPEENNMLNGKLPTYTKLKTFLTAKMEMQQVYPPDMLLQFLHNGGNCCQNEIATLLLSYKGSRKECA